MITWFDLTRMDLRGRDLVIQDPPFEVRGRIQEIYLNGRMAEFFCEWFAERLPGGRDWMRMEKRCEELYADTPTAPVLIENGMIILPADGFAYGRVFIAVPGDKLPAEKVPTLDWLTSG